MSWNHRRPFTEERYDAWMGEGRGTGSGAEYKPWLTKADVRVKFGHHDRFICPLSGRLIAVFDQLQGATVEYFQAAPGIKDIREHYPLPRDDTRRIANSLGIEHPKDIETRVDLVITTDLLIDIQTTDGTTLTLPRSCRGEKSLRHFRIAEKDEIERRYWAEHGKIWKLIVESSIPEATYANLELLRQWRRRPESEQYLGYFDALKTQVVDAVHNATRNETVQQFAIELDQRLGIRAGNSMEVLLHLIYIRSLRANIAQPILSQSIAEISQRTKMTADQGDQR